MTSSRLVPLIVAVALFMENMDSTVIATSLPAIAADLGTSPLTLKLAVTSYLLSLAVFIPISGWTADRFGTRTVFRAAIAVFVLGSIGCAAVAIGHAICDRAHRSGHGRRDDDARRPPGAGPHHRSPRTGRCHGVGFDPGDGRPAARSAAWRLHHHLCVVALDLSDQCADRADRHLAGDALHRGHPRAKAGPLRHAWNDFVRVRRRRAVVRLVGGGLRPHTLACRGGAAPWRRDRVPAVSAARATRARAHPRFQPAEAADVPRQPARRLSVPDRRWRAALPAAAPAAGRISSHAVPVRTDHVHRHARRYRHEDRLPRRSSNDLVSAPC